MKKYVLIAALGLSTIAVTAAVLGTNKKPAKDTTKTTKVTKESKKQCTKKMKLSCDY